MQRDPEVKKAVPSHFDLTIPYILLLTAQQGLVFSRSRYSSVVVKIPALRISRDRFQKKTEVHPKGTWKFQNQLARTSQLYVNHSRNAAKVKAFGACGP